MNVFIGNTTQGSIGTQTFLTPGVTTIKILRITMGSQGTLPASDTIPHFSYGVSQDNNGTIKQYAHSVLGGGISRTSNAYAISHYDSPSGVLRRVVSASLVSFGVGQFTLNFDRADGTYPIIIEAIGD